MLEISKQKRKENKTMNESKNKTMIREAGYNICPKCGGQAYAITMDEGVYYVGCLYCGLQHGVSILINNQLTEEIIEQMRIDWNKKCVESLYDEDVIVMLGALNKEYIIVNRADNHILFIARDILELLEFVDSMASFIHTEVYVMHEGHLRLASFSCLKNEILNELKKHNN